MISGSNCCDPWTLHLFSRKADGTFSARREVKFARTDSDPVLRLIGLDRGLSRPQIFDWDRDGKSDLVIFGPQSWKPLVGSGPLAGKSEYKVKPFPLPELPDVLPQHFEITDWDGDGLFDLLTAAQYRNDKGSPWVWAVYWLRNTSKAGEPKFESPTRLLTVSDPWEVNGIAVAHRGRSGRPDIVVSVTRGWQRKKEGGWTVDSRLWLYRRRG
jgi:hypothetical protein